MDAKTESAAIALADTLCLAESDHFLAFLCTLPLNHDGKWHEARQLDGELVAKWQAH